jgi:glycosyltransferase involved in cell wall biosynthesis
MADSISTPPNSLNFKKIAIIYLGRRGAGLDLTLWMANFFERSNGKLCIFASSYATPQIKLGEDSTDLLLFKTFNSIRELILAPLRPFKIAKYIRNILLSEDIETIIFPMPHIWDLIILNKIKKLNLKIVCTIHDDKAHKGERFPPSWFIKRLVRYSQVVIFFSEAVRIRVQTSKKDVYVCQLPALIGDTKNSRSNLMKSGLLFLGRIEKYKGLNVLMDAYALLAGPRMELTIAGAGKLQKFDYSNFNVINRWLSNSEIIEQLNLCEVLVLPYLEATQSGIIPIAMNLDVTIVYSMVGGLTEQLSAYPKKVGVIPGSPKKLAEAIEKAISGNFDPVLRMEKSTLSSALFQLIQKRETDR